jgi:hypothetical protein
MMVVVVVVVMMMMMMVIQSTLASFLYQQRIKNTVLPQKVCCHVI